MKAQHLITEERRRTLCAWLEANNINPSDIPMDAKLDLDDKQRLTVDMVVRDGHGKVKMVMDGRLLTEPVTFAVETLPPWLPTSA